jgi:hypothetical protein
MGLRGGELGLNVGKKTARGELGSLKRKLPLPQVYVVLGDKLRQIRDIFDGWGWTENRPTNFDDRLVFDVCWAGRALKVDWMFGYLPGTGFNSQVINHFRGKVKCM